MTLFDQAELRRDAAVAVVEGAADRAWLALATDAIEDYLRTHGEFFADDFWQAAGLPRPRESRALGPVIQTAARRGWIVKTGEYRPSVASNLAAKPVWRSLLCDEAVGL